MKKFLIILLCLAISSHSFAVDEYVLPDATNFVDLRHVKRATCTVLYHQPAYIEYKEGSGPAIGGDSTSTQQGAFVGSQIGGFLGGYVGSYIGSLLGQSVGLSMSVGGGKPPSPIFHSSEMRLLGTGVVYADTQTHYYVLTAGHAVDRVPYIQFNYAGERSQIIKPSIAMIINEGFDDLCVLSFPKSALGDYPKPTIIPLSTKEVDDLDSNCDVVVMRFGSITPTKIAENHCLTFQLTAKIHKGISGSPVVDKTGKRLLGIVLKLDGECLGYQRITQLLKNHNEKAIQQNKERHN